MGVDVAAEKKVPVADSSSSSDSDDSESVSGSEETSENVPMNEEVADDDLT